MKLRPVILALLMLVLQDAAARGVYQDPDAFLNEIFAGEPPRPQVLWLRGEIKKTAEEILGHRYGSLRVRYWQQGDRTAWILEEIGKEEPITTGLVVRRGRMERLRVLVYRESRGGEVRYDFFTDQFRDASLGADQALDRTIDNISGATLSVRALTKLARLALYFDGQVTASHVAPSP
jgi:hypothetical protein